MEIYRIVNRETNEEVGVYMPPTARDEYNFSSIYEARHSNCHGIYEDKVDYKIRKYKLVLIDDDCDPPTDYDYKEKELEKACEEKNRELQKQISLEKFNKPLGELDVIECLDVWLESTKRNIDELRAVIEKNLEDDIDDNINCSTCAYNVEFPPPHTCDICTSLDEEEYCMWQAKENNE